MATVDLSHAQPIPTPQALAAPQDDGAVQSTRSSKDDRVQGAIQKALVSAEGMSLSSKTFQNTLNIISFFLELPRVISAVITVAKIPCISFDIVSCISASYDIHKTRRHYRVLTSAVQKCQQNSSQDTMRSVMRSVVNTLDEMDDADVIRKTFNLSCEGKKALKEKVQTMRQHIANSSIDTADVECIRLLTKRAKTHIGQKIAETTINCVSVAAGIIIVVPVPVAAQIVSAVLYTACAVTMAALWAITELFSNHNPLDPSFRCPVMTVIHSGIHKIQAATKHIHTWFEPKKAAATAWH